MRYITRATLLARHPLNAGATIFIPPGEVIEADTDPESTPSVRLCWRGQILRVMQADLFTATEVLEASLTT